MTKTRTVGIVAAFIAACGVGGFIAGAALDERCRTDTATTEAKHRAELEVCHLNLSPGRQITEALIQELEILHHDVCVCLDSTCASRVQQRFEKVMDRYRGKDGGASDEQFGRFERLVEQMVECADKAQQLGAVLGLDGAPRG